MSLIPWRATDPGAERPVGLFVSHLDTVRIRAHFERLREQSADLVDWVFLLNPSALAEPRCESAWPLRQHAATCLPGRYQRMIDDGGVLSGYMDMVLVPAALSAPSRHVWLIEYDVDYSGHWRDFFVQFRHNRADLLTTTVVRRDRCPEWFHWGSAVCPPAVRARQQFRAFLPLTRVSQRFLQHYCAQLADARWQGHYEFLFPSVAAHTGLRIEDLRRRRPWWGGGPPNYLNQPRHGWLTPGTFLWRPSRAHYFHEAPQQFERLGMLHHPIKTDNTDWERA